MAKYRCDSAVPTSRDSLPLPAPFTCWVAALRAMRCCSSRSLRDVTSSSLWSVLLLWPLIIVFTGSAVPQQTQEELNRASCTMRYDLDSLTAHTYRSQVLQYKFQPQNNRNWINTAIEVWQIHQAQVVFFLIKSLCEWCKGHAERCSLS